MATFDLPKVGEMVRVRSRRHVVEAVLEPRETHPWEQHRVRLACIEDDSAGEASEVLWEVEPDARVISARESASLQVDRFDPPAHFAAWYHSVRWNSLSVADKDRVQAPFRAGISVESYQFEPLTRALAQPRVRLFIADDVGLGKTIEAALIVRELMLRQRVRRVIVAAPPSVVTQWRDELDTRFGLTFVVVDRDYLRARRRERGWQFNPWKTHPRFIISHALLRDPHYTAPLRALLQQEPHGSMLVLDEAHHAAPASGGRITVDSAFTRTLRELAPLFEHRVFLSATPHNGHSNSFAALMEILDPSRFLRGIAVTPALRKQVMIRRLKSQLRDIGVEFPERQVVRIPIANLADDDPDVALPRMLDDYCTLREEAAEGGSKQDRTQTKLVLTSLRKRLLSSIFAFKRTLAAHRRGLANTGENGPTPPDRRGRPPCLPTQETSHTPGQPRGVAPTPQHAALPELFDAPGPDDERAQEEPEAIEEALEDTVARASSGLATTTALPHADALLAKMLELASAHAERPDARVKALVQWIKDNLRTGDGWNLRRLIIFTEYVDTQRYLVRMLTAAFRDTAHFSQRYATLDGQPGNTDARDELKERFNADPTLEPLRILVCTDAAREGINLQAHCTDLFHFDLPWNPSRLEQRNGRIDRKGQPAPVVRCHYFELVQRPEDRVLATLVRKTATIHKELGSLGEVLVTRVETLLRNGISRRNAASLTQEIEQLDLLARIPASAPVTAPEETPDADDVTLAPASAERVREEVGDGEETRAELQAAKEQNERLRAEAEAQMEFSPESFRRALNVALERLHAPAITPDPKLPERWHLAPLDGSPATLPEHEASVGRRIDPSWAETLDGLRIPYGLEPGHDERPYPPSDRWTWRRRSRLRPLRFRASAVADGSSVHMHLEHRVAQRLLGQLSAQAFSRDVVARATVLSLGRGADRVVLLGRLCLFGNHGARLHDEIVLRAAIWPGADGERTAPLKPMALRSEELTTARKDLQEALARPSDEGVTEFHRARFLRSVGVDIEQLRTPLHLAAFNRSEEVTERLRRLGRDQARALADLLTRQQAQIEKKLTSPKQLSLAEQKGFSDSERTALRSMMRAWEQRREAIKTELDEAPKAVQEEYSVKHTHIELLGVVYLTRGS